MMPPTARRRAALLAVSLVSGTVFPCLAAEGGLRHEVRDGVVEARAGDEVRWSFDALARRKDARPTPAPALVGEVVVFCAEAQLYEASAADGKIQRRLLLPGRCEKIEARGERYEVRCQGGSAEHRWTRSFELRPGEGDPGTVLPSEVLTLLTPRRQADELASKDPAEREASVARLLRQREIDPTNPWLDLRRAELLRALGRGADAAQAIRDALAHDRRYDLELIMMSARLRALDPQASDEAFQRGLGHLLARGYEPEMTTSALLPVVLLGRPSDPAAPGQERRKLDPAADHVLLEKHAARLLDVAPNAEGSSSFFAALARAAEQRGDQAAAQRWKPLAEREEGSGPFAPAPPEGRDAGLLVQLVASLAFALIFVGVIRSLRALSLRHVAGAPWWVKLNPLSRWDRGEQVGFLAAQVLVFVLASRAAVGVAALGLIAAAPMPLASGNPGHPEARIFLDAGPDAPASRFFRALSAQRAGDLAAAEGLYEGHPAPQALVNLGAIAAARGDRARAESLWQQALARSPALEEAHFNLGHPTTGARSERARRYQQAGPLLALPTRELWADLWRERAHVSTPSGVRGLFSLVDTVSVNPFTGSETHASVLLSVVLASLALLALLSPRRLVASSPVWSYLGGALSLTAPGAARLYGLLGPFVGAAVVFLAMCARMLDSSSGQSMTVLGAIASPSAEGFYGAALARPELPALVPLARFWWVALLLNAALVVAIDLRRASRPRP